VRCLLFSNAAFAGIFRIQVSGAPGSTVVPSQFGFTPLHLPSRDGERLADVIYPSVITLKPATYYQFKTGHFAWIQT
jgi:hypothetical protein